MEEGRIALQGLRGDLFELIPIPLEPRGSGGGRADGIGAVGEEPAK